MRNRSVHLALFLLLFPSNACGAWDITGNDDYDFWRHLQQNDRASDEQRRARKRRDEEIKKFDDERTELKRRNRPLFQSDNDDLSQLENYLDNYNDEKDNSNDLILRYHSRSEVACKLADKKEWHKLVEAHDQLGDWVPSKADRQQNGGFGITLGNGRPVPYKLNGHINIERKLPWQDEN